MRKTVVRKLIRHERKEAKKYSRAGLPKLAKREYANIRDLKRKL